MKYQFSKFGTEDVNRMRKVIDSLETLEAIITGAGCISTYQHPPKGYDVELRVYGGVVDLTNVVVIGMCIRFVGCEIKSELWDDGFLKCDLSLYDVVGTRIRFEDCDTTVEHSALSHCTVTSGVMYIDKDNMYIDKGSMFNDTSIAPQKLYAFPNTVVAIHKVGRNAIGFNTIVDSATASCGSFGTYDGNVHYFMGLDTVIAGCWMGTLEEFPIKAKKRNVDATAYEAVYNYFKTFN